MVSDPSVMISWRRMVCMKVDESLIRFSGRNRFSRMGSTVGKRIWNDEMGYLLRPGPSWPNPGPNRGGALLALLNG